MHLLTSARIKLALVPRIVVAVVIVLALLSGIAPFKSASAGNLCTMACCAGAAPHAAGSCHMEMRGRGRPRKLSQETAPEDNGAPGVSEGISGATAGVMGMTTNGESSLNLDAVTVEASPDHCEVHSQAKADKGAAGTSGDSNSDYANYSGSIAAHSLTKPCPPECGSGPTVSRVRRSTDAATVARNARPRSTFVKKYFYQTHDLVVLSTYCEQIHPRGPPLSFS